jgi:hypothetical protein
MQPFSAPRRTNPFWTYVAVSVALSAAALRKPLRSQPVQGRRLQNTGDLQWEMRANYNARPCTDGGKTAGARTMGINGKTMRRTMENNEKYTGGDDYVRL